MSAPKGAAGGMSGGPSSPGSSEFSQKDMAQMLSGQTSSSSNFGQTSAGGAMGGAFQTQPRPVGTPMEELKRGASDIWDEVKKFFSINTWMGIDPEKLNPDQKAHAQKIHQGYQRLDQQQQAVARQMYEQRLQQKQIQEEEERQKKIADDQKEASQSIEIPSGPQKGPVGPSGSKKQKAMTKLKQDRTTMNNVAGE